MLKTQAYSISEAFKIKIYVSLSNHLWDFCIGGLEIYVVSQVAESSLEQRSVPHSKWLFLQPYNMAVWLWKSSRQIRNIWLPINLHVCKIEMPKFIQLFKTRWTTSIIFTVLNKTVSTPKDILTIKWLVYSI